MLEINELTERQKDVVLGRVGQQMERILRCSMDEHNKLRAIGVIVGGYIHDVRPPNRSAQVPVLPSILPQHDGTTIERLARLQKILRESELSAPRCAEIMDKMELAELQIQRDDRPRAGSPAHASNVEPMIVDYYLDE